MRIVLDANVIVSAIITPHGTASEVFRLWQKDAYELIVSLPTLGEIERVLHYPKLRGKYQLTDEYITSVVELLATSEIVEPQVKLAIVEKDETDNRYLECAVAGSAQYIVSGNIHLLEIKVHEGIYILSPASFLALLENEIKQ